jgi:hypothetical protein
MNARLLFLGFVCCSASAFAWGPVAEVGATITTRESYTQQGSTVTFNRMVGPRLLVGLELGDRFNHELGFEYSTVSGTGTTLGVDVPISTTTIAGRYTFSVDLLKKEGFTPLVGVGLAVGQFRVTGGSAATGGVEHGGGVYLAFHAVAGLRYTFENGLGLKAQFTVSTYGGLIGLQPSLAAAWRF